MRRKRSSWTARALLKLESRREVLLLVCVEGLSYRETAETLGLPMGTVMSRLARARLAVARLTEGVKDDDHGNVVHWS